MAINRKNIRRIQRIKKTRGPFICWRESEFENSKKKNQKIMADLLDAEMAKIEDYKTEQQQQQNNNEDSEFKVVVGKKSKNKRKLDEMEIDDDNKSLPKLPNFKPVDESSTVSIIVIIFRFKF